MKLKKKKIMKKIHRRPKLPLKALNTKSKIKKMKKQKIEKF